MTKPSKLLEASGYNEKSGVLHLRAITGLRFLAAFVVFYSHVEHFLLPGERLLVLGAPAVSFFFVLSGFILTYVYHQRLTWRRTPRFLFTRWARLWPVHVVCLTIGLQFMWISPGMLPDHAHSWASLIAQYLMVQTWVPVRNWYVEYNSVSWSIATEMFFYLAFPLLLLGKRSHFWWKYLLVIIVAGITIYCFQYGYDNQLGPEWLGYVGVPIAFPLIRLVEFATGMATCFLMLKWNVKFAERPSKNKATYVTHSLWELFAVALIVCGWVLVYKTQLADIVHGKFGFILESWFHCANGLLFYAFAICVFSVCRGLIGQVLSSRFFVWLGEISFAFYLIHQIVIIKLNFLGLGNIEFCLLSFFISLFASAVLFRIIEMPFRNALLTIYDRKAGWFRKWTAGLVQTFSQPWAAINAIALAGLICFVCLRPSDQIQPAEQQRIVRQSLSHLRHVEFTNEATLLGVEALRVDRGVMLRFVWTKNRSWSRQRFLHICDKDGNILSQGKHELKEFMKNDAYQGFVDEVIVHKGKLKDPANYICVGFWSQELGCAVVKSEHAEMNDRRLKVIDLTDLPPPK